MLNFDSLTEAQIIQRLKNNTQNTYDLPTKLAQHEYQKASVLIPFVRINKAWHILFIRRAKSNRDRHSGQVAFVGGKAEAEDCTDIDTALRETHEEIGVKPTDVKVLGQLAVHRSLSHFQVTPIVGTFTWPYKIQTNPAEVSHTFTLPLNWLANENNYKERMWQSPETNFQAPVIYFDEYEGELLWGATARMVLSLIGVLKQR